MKPRIVSFVSALLVLAALVMAASVNAKEGTPSVAPAQAQEAPSLPTVVIQNPASGSQVALDQLLIIEVNTQDSQGVTYIELTQSGRLVQRIQNPAGASPEWRAFFLTRAAPVGVVSYEVRAYRGNIASAPAILQLSVVTDAASISRPAALPAEFAEVDFSANNCRLVILAGETPIYANPDTTSEAISQASLGAVLTVQTGSSQWWQVNLNGTVGWVPSTYGETIGSCQQSPQLPSGCTVTVADAGASLRTDPNANSSILFSLPSTTTWNAVGQAEGWIQLDVEGAIGWVNLAEVTLGDNCPADLASVASPEPTALVNQPPTVNAIPNQTLAMGQNVSVPVVATDPEGYNVTIASVESGSDQVASVAPDGEGNLVVTAVSAGQVNIIFSVDDGLGGVTTSQFTVLVLQPTDPVNNPPLVEPVQDISLGYDESAVIQITASDPEGFNPYLESVTSSANTIASVENIGNRQVKVGAVSPGQAQITVTVADGQGGLTSVTFRANIAMPPSPTPNLPPQVQAVPDQVVGVGQTVTVFIQATDPEGFFPFFNSVTSSANTIVKAEPDGEGNIRLVGVSPGQARVEFVMDDANGGQTSMGFGVQVEDFTTQPIGANLPPIINPIAAQVVKQGEFLPLTIQVTDPEGKGVSLTVSSTSPSIAAAQVSDNGITIFGQGTGSASVTVVVTDEDGQSSAVVFPVAVESEVVSGVDVTVLPSLPQWSGSVLTTVQALYANQPENAAGLLVIGDTLPTDLASDGGAGVLDFSSQPNLAEAQAAYTSEPNFAQTTVANPAWSAADLLNPANVSADCGDVGAPVACGIASTPSVAVIFIGRNDVLAKTSLNDFRASISTVLDQLTAANIIPIVATIPGDSALVTPYNQALAQVTTEKSLPLWNLWASVPAVNVNPDDLTLTVPPTGTGETLALTAVPQYGASQRNVELWNVLTGLRLALGM